MTILVAYASAHWSTKGIAEEIADRLTKAGFKTALHSVGDLTDLRLYEAVVLGSAIHNQAWLPEAAEFLTSHASELARLPVWLFSVSSVGSKSSFFGPQVSQLIRSRRREPDVVRAARPELEPRDHHYFAGAIERGHWNRDRAVERRRLRLVPKPARYP